MNSIKAIKKKNILTLLIVIIIIIIINVFSANVFTRIDMTAEKRYTLTDYTKKTLKNLKGKVYITVYLDGKDLPLQFKKFRSLIKEDLEIFKVYAGKNLDYTFVNPTDEKMPKAKRENLYKELYQLGIAPVENSQIKEGQATKTMIFPAAVISYSFYNPKNDSLITRKVGINLLNNDPNYKQSSPQNINNSVQTLEYKFINEIKKLGTTKKQRIVFLEGQGELPEANVIDIERALGEYYDIMRGQIGGRYGALNEFSAVIIAKPTKVFSEKDKFVLDQYLMQGGKILWLIDGVNVDMDSIYNYGRAYAFPALPATLKIQDQLFTYGARINSDILQDYNCSTIMLKGITATGEERNHWYKWYYFPLLITKNDNVINKYLDLIRTEFVSSIDTVGENPEIKKTILLSTSNMTKDITVNFPLQIDFKEINDVPNPKSFNSGSKPVAVLLEGIFPSLWKGRIVRKMLPYGAKFLDKSVPTKMIVVADGDICKNVVKTNGEVFPLDFDKYSLQSYGGNKQFIINSLNYLCDDQGLMSIRSREFKLRLLDKDKITTQRSLWQMINLLLPIILIVLFGVLFYFIRSRKYTKK